MVWDNTASLNFGLDAFDVLELTPTTIYGITFAFFDQDVACGLGEFRFESLSLGLSQVGCNVYVY